MYNRNGVFSFRELSVLRKLKQKLGFWNWIKHFNIQIYQLKLSRKTLIYFQTSFARVLTIPSNSLFSIMLETFWCKKLHKKCNKRLKESYRPVSILLILLKVFERSMLKQMSSFFSNIFSKYQYRFGKGFSTQQCLSALLEKWKRSTDKSNADKCHLLVSSSKKVTITIGNC